MSLVGTLAKVAVGVIVAKGVGKMMKGGGGGLLGGLTGGDKKENQSNVEGISDIGDLLGGRKGQAGGLGGVLDSLGGNSQASGGIGGMLNQAINGERTAEPSQSQEDQAKVLLRGMLSAARSDGNIDKAEQAKITKHLDELSEDDANFIRAELEAPVDVDRVVRSVPRGMEQQAYVMSVLAIDLDSQVEARYLDQLASGLNISQQTCDSIHSQLGVPKLYS